MDSGDYGVGDVGGYYQQGYESTGEHNSNGPQELDNGYQESSETEDPPANDQQNQRQNPNAAYRHPPSAPVPNYGPQPTAPYYNEHQNINPQQDPSCDNSYPNTHPQQNPPYDNSYPNTNPQENPPNDNSYPNIHPQDNPPNDNSYPPNSQQNPPYNNSYLIINTHPQQNRPYNNGHPNTHPQQNRPYNSGYPNTHPQPNPPYPPTPAGVYPPPNPAAPSPGRASHNANYAANVVTPPRPPPPAHAPGAAFGARIQQFTIRPDIGPPVPWASELFGCFDDFYGCPLVIFAPCITFGQIAEIVDTGYNRCQTASIIYALALFLGIPCLYSYTYRTRMRHRFNLREDPLDDFWTHFLCEFCALAQEYREIRYRGIDPSIGYDMQRETITNAMEAPVPPKMQGRGRPHSNAMSQSSTF